MRDSGFSSLFRIAPLTVLTSVDPASGIKRNQVEALAYLIRKLYTPAYRMGWMDAGRSL